MVGVVDRQEADGGVGGDLPGLRVDGGEGPGDHAGGDVHASRDIDVVAFGGGEIELRAVEGLIASQRVGEVVEAEAGEAEGVPVQVGVELLGDGDLLRRGGGGDGVLEVDGVGKRGGGGDEVLLAKSSGSDDQVGIARGYEFGCPCIGRVMG